ncbi:hypothetical protein CsatB_016405 [Cannabis sativa]
MKLPIPNKVLKLWDAWHLRGCIILSLLTQAFLVSLASRRRHSKSTFLLFLIWSAYLLADWIAAVAIGAIIKSQGDLCDPLKEDNKDDLLSFWASFLLLHLGGPDTITSFALEDNEFWLRHIFGLALQGLAAAYSIFLTLPTTKLWLPATLVLVVGIVKYCERVYALYLASLDRVASIKDKISTQNTRTTLTTTSSSHIEMLELAYKTYQIFKGPLLGRFYIRNPPPSLGSVNHITAFKFIEYELSIMYEVLHTKLVVVSRKIGYIFRFIGFCFILTAFILFILVENKGLELPKFDIVLTYALLTGAIVLDSISALQLVCSDWSLGGLEGKWKSYIPLVIVKRQRWSNSVSQYNLISYCLDGNTMCPLNKFDHNILDKIKIMMFSSSHKVHQDTLAYIFNHAKSKSDSAYNSDTAIFGALLFRGHQTTWDYPKLEWSIKNFEFAESLLLWHLATELICCSSRESVKICKIISDYMFYLMIMQPLMLSSVLGSNWKVGFQDTVAATKRFLAKNKIISVETKLIRRSDVDDESKSVLFDAYKLATELREMDDHMWEAMDQMWVEIMCYTAAKCKPIVHAQQLGKGGELLTLTWLLLNHFGLGFQFFL